MSSNVFPLSKVTDLESLEKYLENPDIDINKILPESLRKDGGSVLHFVMDSPKINAYEILKKVLKYPKVEIDLKDKKGNTAYEVGLKKFDELQEKQDVNRYFFRNKASLIWERKNWERKK